MKKQVLIFALISLSGISSLHALTTFVSTAFDRSGWEAAVTGAITNDGFDTLLSQASVLNFDSGVTSTASGQTGSPAHVVDFDNGTSSNTFRTTVNTATSGVDGYTTITWVFPSAVTAFGADFLSIGGSREVGPTGTFDSGDEHFILRDLFGGTDRGFFGLVSDTPFTQIVIEATGSISSNDSIRIDNLAFGIPEPSSLVLLAGSLGYLFAARRRTLA